MSSLPQPRCRPRQPAALPRRCSVRTSCAPHAAQTSREDDSSRHSDARWQRPLACLAAVLMSGTVPARLTESTNNGDQHQAGNPSDFCSCMR